MDQHQQTRAHTDIFHTGGKHSLSSRLPLIFGLVSNNFFTHAWHAQIRAQTRSPPSAHTHTHLSGRGCICGVKCGRQREEYRRREAVKTHLCLVFRHGGFILPHRPPANQRYGTKIKPRRLIPANVPRTTAACWAAGRREFMPRTRRERPAVDALVFCARYNAQNHAFTL